MKKVLILASQPTPNGDLHLGHLAGPYLRADIYARYSRMMGKDAYLLSGVDEHQSYMALKAQQMRLGPREVVDQFTATIQQTLAAARIEVDFFGRPSHISHYQPQVENFFLHLQTSNRLIEKEEACPFCEKCNLYLFEAFIHGLCPHCGEPAPGNSCEACGRPNQCHDLQQAVCQCCDQKPTLRRFRRLYIPLAAYEKPLRRYLERVTVPAHVAVLCEQMMNDGLPDIPVTHPCSWGIPASGYPGQKLYGWFTLVPGLLALTQSLADSVGERGGWERFWKEDDVEIVKFFGFDNGYFYGLLFPALLLAYDPEIRLPHGLMTNEFYRLDDYKFSTSRNHAIWGRELLRTQNPDLVRFYLAYSGPEIEQTSFRLVEYKETVKREILQPWAGWLHELGERIACESHGRAPAAVGWTGNMHQFHSYLNQLPGRVAACYERETFSPQRASRLLCELVRSARYFGKAEDHWKHLSGAHSRRQTAMALELAAARMLALLAAPLMPDFAASLWRDLGHATLLRVSSWSPNAEWVMPGAPIADLRRSYFESHENVELSPRAVGTYT
jgi:methionyl-tRNA synthetase